MVTGTPSPSPLSSADEERDQIAGLQILRQFAVFVAIGYAAYAFLTIPAVAASGKAMEPWWMWITVPLTFGTGIALGPLAWRAPRWRIKAAAAVATAAFVTTICLWWFGWNGELIDGPGIWFSFFCGLAAIAAAIAFRPIVAFLALCVVVSSSVIINHLMRTPEFNGPLIPDMAWAFAFCLIYFAASVMALRTASILDSTRDEAFAVTAEASAVRARASERQRFAQLTHDGIMSTLLAASRHGASPLLSQHARETLAALDGMATKHVSGDISASEAVASVRAAVTAVNPERGCEYRINSIVPDSARYPVEVVSTIAAAAAEALRNSYRHAGPGAHTSVRVRAHVDNFSVEVADDGVGFDPRTVRAERLGIAVSISGGMGLLEGGSSTIESNQMEGTRVVLEWSAP